MYLKNTIKSSAYVTSDSILPWPYPGPFCFPRSMQDRLAAATPRLRETAYAAGETGSTPSRSTAWYSEWLSLNTHLHALVLDGVYQSSEDGGAPVFIEASVPGNDPLQTLLHKIIRRILKLLTRLGHLIEEDGITYLARSENIDPDEVMAPLQAASSTWRIAAGPRAGRKVLTLAG